MFVERLTREQRVKIVEKIVPKTVYRFQVEHCHFFHKEEPYQEIFLYDKEKGNYSICLYDTYVGCRYKACNYELKQMHEKAVKEMYKIFGKEYKDYYMKHANSIFEEQEEDTND